MIPHRSKKSNTYTSICVVYKEGHFLEDFVCKTPKICKICKDVHQCLKEELILENDSIQAFVLLTWSFCFRGPPLCWQRIKWAHVFLKHLSTVSLLSLYKNSRHGFRISKIFWSKEGFVIDALIRVFYKKCGVQLCNLDCKSTCEGPLCGDDGTY